MPFHELINVDTIEQVMSDRELAERSFWAVARKYGVFEQNITDLLTFTRACLGICERFDSDPFKIVNDLESYRTVCDELETDINYIGSRLKAEKQFSGELTRRLLDTQDAFQRRAVERDISVTGGMIQGLEFALSSLGDLMELGFGDSEGDGE